MPELPVMDIVPGVAGITDVRRRRMRRPGILVALKAPHRLVSTHQRKVGTAMVELPGMPVQGVVTLLAVIEKNVCVNLADLMALIAPCPCRMKCGGGMACIAGQQAVHAGDREGCEVVIEGGGAPGCGNRVTIAALFTEAASMDIIAKMAIGARATGVSCIHHFTRCVTSGAGHFCMPPVERK